MDHSLPRPLGLAVLITATVTLFSAGAMDQAEQSVVADAIAQPTPAGIALSRHAFSPSVVTTLQSKAVRPTEQRIHARARQRQLRQNTLKKQQLWGHHRHPELQKERPEDIRTARLMLSVESLFKSTTAN